MGILSNLFGKGPDRSQWLTISTRIARRFEESRIELFEDCIKHLEQLNTYDSEKQIPLVNKSLSGEAELYLKAFQLMIAVFFLTRRSYIAKSQGQDFADLLFSQVCGTQIAKVDALARELSRKETQMQVPRIASVVARHITNHEYTGGVETITFFLSTASPFIKFTQMIIAEAFRDQATAQELDSKLS